MASESQASQASASPLEVNGQRERPSPQSHPGSSNSASFLKRFISTKRNADSSSKTQERASEEVTQPKAHGDLTQSYVDISAQSGGKQHEARNGEGSGSKQALTALQKTKLAALDRLRRFGGSKSAGKITKDKVAEFPPASWNIDEETGLSTQSVDEVKDGGVDVKNDEVDVSGTDEVPGEIAVIPPDDVSSPNDGGDDVVEGIPPPETPDGERTEPTSLARRIQILLSSMPRVSFSAPSPTEPPIPPPLDNDLTKPTSNADPLPPSQFPEPNPKSAALIDDTKLISQLSSASIMNGSISKGRESVWAVLDRLGLSRTASSLGMVTPKGKEKATEEMQDEDLKKVVEGDRETPGSEDVMLYAPLEPDDASVVEVARSEVIEVTDDEGTVMDGGASDSEGTKAQVSKVEVDKKGKGKATPDKPSKSVKEKVIWVPSTTKISLQATWWGYRIYLPPPVLRVLNSKSMEAAKRATLLTTALKWLLDHIPTAFLPPQVRPAATLLKRLVPLLGYIGAFIAWSWGAIRTFDRGYGVILSATWLLPVALIPGAWDESDFPKVEGQMMPMPMPAPMQQTQMQQERRFW